MKFYTCATSVKSEKLETSSYAVHKLQGEIKMRTDCLFYVTHNRTE